MKKFALIPLLYLASIGIASAGTFPPAVGDYGVRGVMNGWGLDAMNWDAGASTYTVRIEIMAGIYDFKISDNDWSDSITFGNFNSQPTFTPDDTPIAADIATGFGTDWNLDIASDGTYEFVLDLSAWTNSGAGDAALSISQVPLPAAGLLFVSALFGLGLRRRRD